MSECDHCPAACCRTSQLWGLTPEQLEDFKAKGAVVKRATLGSTVDTTKGNNEWGCVNLGHDNLCRVHEDSRLYPDVCEALVPDSPACRQARRDFDKMIEVRTKGKTK